MKILVTGGAGFIGSHLVDAFLVRGDHVVIVDDLSSGNKANILSALSKGAKFYAVPLQSKEIHEILRNEKPDLISHHAAQKSVRDSVENPLKDADINLIGLLNLLEAARRTTCRRVIFASSGGVVYGEQKIFPADEMHPCRPVSPYGVSKLASELYLDYYASQFNFQCAALRYANVYGPRQDPHGEAGVVAIFCKRMLKREPTVIFGTGKKTRDFVFVEDVVSANLAAERYLVENPQAGLQAWNIGTAREMTILEVHQQIAKCAKIESRPKFEGEKPGEQERSSLSSELMRKKTGWQPAFSLEDGLRKTYDWFQAYS